MSRGVFVYFSQLLYYIWYETVKRRCHASPKLYWDVFHNWASKSAQQISLYLCYYSMIKLTLASFLQRCNCWSCHGYSRWKTRRIRSCLEALRRWNTSRRDIRLRVGSSILAVRLGREIKASSSYWLNLNLGKWSESVTIARKSILGCAKLQNSVAESCERYTLVF